MEDAMAEAAPLHDLFTATAERMANAEALHA
jgi:hypothetical protein